MTGPESPWEIPRREDDEEAGTIIGRPPAAAPKPAAPGEQPPQPALRPQSTQIPQQGQYPQQGLYPPGPVHGAPYQLAPPQYAPTQAGPPQAGGPQAGGPQAGPPQAGPPPGGPAPNGPPQAGYGPPQAAYGPPQAAYGPPQAAAQQAAPPPQTAPPQAAPPHAGPPQAGPGTQSQAAPHPPAQGGPYPPGADQTAPTPPAQTAPPETPLAVPAPWSTTVTRPSGETSAEVAARSAAQGAVIAPAGAGAPRAEALAIPDAGHRGPPRTKRGDHRRPSAPGRALSGKLARLRIGSHTVSRSALGQLRISSLGAGLVMGADRYQRPVSVRLFRPQSTRVTLIGGTWAGQLVAFRAVGIGARVAVITSEPAAWHGFGERATGRGDRVAVMAAERSLAFMATVQQPVLVIYDLGLVGATSPLPLGPWQTQLTILRHLDSPGVPLVQESDLVMLQRLGGEEAATAGRALRLPGPSSEFLQVMADDMLALVADGADRYISVAQTDVERQQTGVPRR